MRDFSWKYFLMTGDVDAYMLYKEMESRSSYGDELLDDEDDWPDDHHLEFMM